MAKRSGRHAAPFHRRAALHFQCTACGKCCATGADRHVFLDRDEAQRIRAYLGIGWAWFRRRYLRRDAALGWMLQVHHARASCVFLDEHGKCSVYPVRPRQCVTYPFWPEVLASARAWRGEARRCEGIGSGPRIAPRAVAAALRAAGGAQRVDMAGAGGQVSFTLSIPAEEFRRYYDGSAREVVATGHDGRVVRFPVRVLQRFLGHDGVHGEFLLRYDAQRKFVSLERLAGGS